MAVAPLDAEYEAFWYTLKGSVKNFNDDHPSPVMARCVKEATELSDRLNQLQREKEYTLIISLIEQYLINFCWACLPHADDSYRINICLSNLKRWQTASKLHGYNSQAHAGMAFTFFFYKILVNGNKGKDNKDMCDLAAKLGTEPSVALSATNLPDYLTMYIENICEIAVSTERCGTVEQIADNYPDIFHNYVKDSYGDILPAGMRQGRKIINLLKGAPLAFP